MAVRPIVAALSLLSLIACSAKDPATAAKSTADAARAGGSVAPLPPIHYDQTAVLTVDGQPREEQSYRILLADCQKAGDSKRGLVPTNRAGTRRSGI
jgi:hypothetical protein